MDKAATLKAARDGLVREWRESCLDPANADADELKLLRALESARQEADAAPDKFERLAIVLGQDATIQHELERRIARKADRERRIEIEQLRNHCVRLEQRLDCLESKAHGGDVQNPPA
jgi:hypothetical protein